MRTNLVVPFSEKDEAKALGARGEAARKIWYVDKAPDLSPFSRWLPPQGAPGNTAPPGGKAATAKPRATSAAAEVRTGASYLALACDCLPWLGCEKCRGALAEKGWRSKN